MEPLARSEDDARDTPFKNSPPRRAPAAPGPPKETTKKLSLGSFWESGWGSVPSPAGKS